MVTPTPSAPPGRSSQPSVRPSRPPASAINQWLIWVKDQLVLGRSHYHYRHEHIFYGWKGKTSWNRSRKEDSVWDEPRPLLSPEHPTIKPLPLCERAIAHSSARHDVVVDRFLCSGTTL